MIEIHRKSKTGFYTRLSAEELNILKDKASAVNMSRTEYIRNILLFGAARAKTNFNKEYADKLLYELNRIGNNINQIAYQANSSRSVSKNDFSNLYEEYNNLLACFENFVIK